MARKGLGIQKLRKTAQKKVGWKNGFFVVWPDIEGLRDAHGHPTDHTEIDKGFRAYPPDWLLLRIRNILPHLGSFWLTEMSLELFGSGAILHGTHFDLPIHVNAVPQARSCPPRGWSGAEWESVC